MKKTATLLIVFSFLVISASSQITKGQKMIGGGLTFTTSTQKPTYADGKYTTSFFTITPEIAFGLKNNWIVGGGLGYAHTGQKHNTPLASTKSVINVITAGVLVRKFHPLTDNVGIFGQLDVAAGFGKGKETNVQGGNSFTAKTDQSMVTSALRPGFYFKATKKIILEANFGGLGYTSRTSKPDGGQKTTTTEFNFHLTSSIGLGFRVIL